MSDLLAKARATRAERDGQYPDWQETAARFSQDRETDYPLTMIRAKLARDPHLENEDSRIDILNYLLMVEESHRSREGAPFETSSDKIDRLTRERNQHRHTLGAELG